jgi:hypothetical protein
MVHVLLPPFLCGVIMKKTGPEPHQARGRLRYGVVTGLILGIKHRVSSVECQVKGEGEGGE